MATKLSPKDFTDLEPGAAVFATSLGEAGIAWTRRGIDRVLLPGGVVPDPIEATGKADGTAFGAADRLAELVPDRSVQRRQPGPLGAVIKRLRRHLQGRPDELRDIPLDLATATPFARRIYAALRRVAPGGTTTYGDLARRAGSPSSAQAVGRVLGVNPVPLIVPCHRCLPAGVAAGGASRLGGFSGGGGPRQKAHLLFLEGVILHPEHAAGIAHLRRRDPLMRRLIDRIGPYFASPETREAPYNSLLRAIVFQQISVAAGRTIAARLAALTPGPRLPGPDELPHLDDATLRSAGLSPQKTRYARDLAARVSDGRLRLDTLHRLPDDAVVATLTEVLGIGRWTAHMFLIFQLDRLDVLPVDDLGLRNAVKRAHGMDDAPSIPELEAHGEVWRPYRSMASWYLWQALDSGGL